MTKTIVVLLVITFNLSSSFLKAGNLIDISHASRYSAISIARDSLYKKCIVLTNQASSEIAIIDINTNKIIWSWRPSKSNMAKEAIEWFDNPDDAKPVYDCNYLLVNASGGGVALIRIADKKVVFYTYAGKNPHSSEILPDGNIVTASSTDNRLVIIHVDTTGVDNDPYKKIIALPFAHNVVWDKKRNVLWSAGQNKLYKLKYNQDQLHPDLEKIDSILLPGTQAHDLFPVYKKDELWITFHSGVYAINMSTLQLKLAPFSLNRQIKSVSSGPEKWPILLMRPKTSWWSDEVLDSQGHTVFRRPGMKIYKARWLLQNYFSY